MAERRRELGEEPVIPGRDDDLAVLGLEALEGDETARAGAMAYRHLARDPV
jgi:hypothetical protein